MNSSLHVLKRHSLIITGLIIINFSEDLTWFQTEHSSPTLHDWGASMTLLNATYNLPVYKAKARLKAKHIRKPHCWGLTDARDAKQSSQTRVLISVFIVNLIQILNKYSILKISLHFLK